MKNNQIKTSRKIPFEGILRKIIIVGLPLSFGASAVFVILTIIILLSKGVNCNESYSRHGNECENNHDNAATITFQIGLGAISSSAILLFPFIYTVTNKQEKNEQKKLT